MNHIKQTIIEGRDYYVSIEIKLIFLYTMKEFTIE